MGTFTASERIPAKWMARVGQNFSTSKRTVMLTPNQVEIIPDIKPPNSPWIYTDGVGTISPLLARDVEAALNAELTPYELRRLVSSTCYQVRIAGAKGMLSVDPTLHGRKVRLRNSMIKFAATVPTALKVAKEFGRPSPAFTNRPLIQVLEGLGVSPDVFRDLQRRMIVKTEAARASWWGLAGLLRLNDFGHAARLPAVVKWLAPILEAHRCTHISDGFLRRCTNLMVMQAHRRLKFRSRISMPHCWTLVGVVDEEPGGYLAEDEIYVCVHEKSKEPVYLEGEVAISRSPVIDPGDVRLVRAVGKLDPIKAPRVSYQRNCVVFSIKGARPLPSKLGGGDCDGDMYQIISLPGLIPRWMEHPGSYDAPKLELLSRPSTVADAATSSSIL